MVSVSGRSRVIAIALFFACAALLVSAVSLQKVGPLAKPSQAVHPQVTNRTSSVRISNVRRLSNGDVEVTLLNESTKTIYAYTMVTGHRGVRKGFTTFATAVPVAPGETKAETIPARNLDAADATNSNVGSEIVFSAVYLEGGTSEGDPTDAEKLGTMQGMKEQAKFALHLLRNAVASREQDPQRLLETLEVEAASLGAAQTACLNVSRFGIITPRAESLCKRVQRLRQFNLSI